jgi:hypothetical protein
MSRFLHIIFYLSSLFYLLPIYVGIQSRKILTSKRCLALLQGPEGFFAVGERHTYLNGPTVTLRPIPALVWQRGEGLDGVVVKPSINHLVGARAGEDRPCAKKILWNRAKKDRRMRRFSTW